MARYGFSAYGQRPGNDPDDDRRTAVTPLLFAGQYTDAESGLQYLRARYYAPATGQFLTRDPLATKTRQPYSYAVGSPVNFVDPTGLDGEDASDGYSIPPGDNISDEEIDAAIEYERKLAEGEEVTDEEIDAAILYEEKLAEGGDVTGINDHELQDIEAIQEPDAGNEEKTCYAIAVRNPNLKKAGVMLWLF